MLAVLTDDGERFLEQIAPLHVDGVRRHFINHLSRTQLRNLSGAFRAVQRGLAVDARSD